VTTRIPGVDDVPKINPVRIRLEASSFCQLRCPSCPTTSRAIYPAIGGGFLKLKDFKKLLDENPTLEDIELSNYGEILLNPEFLGILEYAHQRHVALRADNGMNLNTAGEQVLEGLVKNKFRSISCSIDGASNETYQQYRVRGNFDTVIENVKKINLFKRQYKSEYPQLTWQFVVFGHNEHEIPLAKKLAAELNMKFRPKLTWDPDFSPVRDPERVRQAIGAASREEYREQHGSDYMQGICHQLWDQPQINWDGKVLGCCRNFWGDFGGNAFAEGLVSSVNNEKMEYARQMLLGRNEAREDIPCSTCEIYLGMKSDGKWLSRESPWLQRVLRFIV
jgi:MoaA/NifB/PqqE/SkfB family radical SAM enzyme